MNKSIQKKKNTMGRGAHSKAMRKINRDFARGKLSVGNGHTTSTNQDGVAQKGHRNTRRGNLKHKKHLTNKMMVFGTPTNQGINRITKTEGKCNDVEFTNDSYNYMKEILKK